MVFLVLLLNKDTEMLSVFIHKELYSGPEKEDHLNLEKLSTFYGLPDL